MHFDYSQYKQKGFAMVYALVGILVLALVAGGAYYFVRSQALKPLPQNPVVSQVPQSTQTPDETADWKTYTNTKYSFSFKYPNNYYSVIEDESDLTNYGVVKTIQLKDIGYQDKFTSWIYVWNNPDVKISDAKSRDVWCSSITKKLDNNAGQLSCDLGLSFSDVVVGGISAYKFSGGRDNSYIDVYYVPFGKYVYEIMLTGWVANENYPPKTQNTFADQILSTFKFLP